MQRLVDAAELGPDETRRPSRRVCWFRLIPTPQRAPQALFDAAAQARNVPFERRAAWQQYLVRHEPRRGALEQHARPVGAGPAKRVQPPGKAKGDQGFREFDVAIARANFYRVLLALSAGAVGACFVQHLDAQLHGQRPQHGLGHGQRIFQKRAQVAHCAQLDGEDKPIVCAALLSD